LKRCPAGKTEAMPLLDNGFGPLREGRWGLKIDESRRGDIVVLRLHGELDLKTAPDLRIRLGDVVRRCDADVVLDLEGVSFIDSTGLAAMLNALRRLTRAGRRLAVVAPEGPVERILRITRLDSTFARHEFVEDALEALAPGSAAA
jgi:anti-sigma B factor antagonist